MSAHLERQRDHYSKLAKKFGLATLKELSARPLRYRWDLIERDINKLLSRPRHLPVAYTGAISDALANYLAVTYLGCCSAENRPPPQELVLLIGQLLDVSRFGVKAANDRALIQAQGLRNENPAISNNVIAKTVGVNPGTVSRWVKAGHLVPAKS